MENQLLNMALREWLGDQQPQALVFWALAALFFVLGLAGIPVLGIEPSLLIILAAVFAALTAEYSR